MPSFKPWHAVLPFALAAAFALLGVSQHMATERKAQEQRDSANAQTAARLERLAIEYAAKRPKLLAEAKEAFVDGRPWATVSKLAPYVEVADSEAIGLYKLAEQQETANAATADQDEAAEEKARLAQCRLRLECWAKENAFAAWKACGESIMAAHDNEYFTWAIPNDGKPHRKFEQFERGPSSPTAVLWSGKNARIQSVQDEFQMVNYWCEYEAESSKVVAIGIDKTGIPWIR